MTTVEATPVLAPPKAAFFGVSLALELVAFAILPLSSRLRLPELLSLQACLAACLLAGTFASRRLQAARPYSPVLYALFAGGTGMMLAALLGGRTLDALSLASVSPAWIALSRLSDVAWQSVGIVLLMAAVGARPSSMYLTRGRLGFGLGWGLAGLAGCAALAFAPMLADQADRGKLLVLAPWIITFALANGFGEELLFRGLLLQRLEPFLGKGWSNVLTAVAYTLLRAPAADARNVAVFLLAVFPLALVWGWLMQRTGSVWGSALLHAGADCLIVFGILGQRVG
jgi:membrane protease YdiL (CAAX protease family)